MNEKILEEYSVQIYEIDRFFMSIKKKKENLMSILLNILSILLNIFQPQKLINKTMKVENLFLKKKRQQALEKKLGCKFIRINTSDAERG